MRVSYLLAFVLLLSGGCRHMSPPGMSSEEAILIGVWREDFGVMGYALNTFNADGSYYGEAYTSATPVTFLRL